MIQKSKAESTIDLPQSTVVTVRDVIEGLFERGQAHAATQTSILSRIIKM